LGSPVKIELTKLAQLNFFHLIIDAINYVRTGKLGLTPSQFLFANRWRQYFGQAAD